MARVAVKRCVNQLVADRITTRFAPSPTGQLHLGHALSAIRSHDLARVAGGAFLLRIEDIDGGRSREEFIGGILEDLAWLGLDWDGPVVRQSARLASYEAALDRLRACGLLYPCFCTRADIAASASAPQGAAGAVYPGTCRGIETPNLNRAHCWRLDAKKALEILPRAGEELRWHDAAAGWRQADAAPHGDIVLARKDAPASYHLAVTLDDAEQGVTDVVRGVDLFASTDVQRLLQALLGLPTPRYHHHPLIADPAGRRLAKRDHAPTLAAMRAAGIDGPGLAANLRAGRLPIGFGWASA